MAKDEYTIIAQTVRKYVILGGGAAHETVGTERYVQDTEYLEFLSAVRCGGRVERC